VPAFGQWQQSRDLAFLGLPVVVVQGTPRERGLQHGAQACDTIRTALSRFRETHGDEAVSIAHRNAERSWSLLLDYAPDIADEIDGIADGSGCDPIEIYTRIGFEFLPTEPVAGCSGMALAVNGGARLGQNWDAPPIERRELILLLELDGQGFTAATIASAGTLGWVGTRRGGIALLTNDLLLDRRDVGLPSQVARRLALRARNVGEALTVLRTFPHMGGRTYLLGDAAGGVMCLEASPEAGVHAMPQANRLFHTNHALLAPTADREDAARLQACYPSSRQRLEILAREGAAAATVTDIMSALRSRIGAPDAVSKEVSPCEPTETVFSIVIDCRKSAVHLCVGPPARGLFASFRLTDPVPVEWLRNERSASARAPGTKEPVAMAEDQAARGLSSSSRPRR
jgi:isopenicillin-N N-acyltransferase-like protein